MKYLLDTPVLEELMRARPDPRVVEWLDACDENTLFISVLTLGELHKKITEEADSTDLERLRAWLDQELIPRFGRRVLPIDAAVASTWGEIAGEAARRGDAATVEDCLIAATALVHHMVVVTRNLVDMARCNAQAESPWAMEGEVLSAPPVLPK